MKQTENNPYPDPDQGITNKNSDALNAALDNPGLDADHSSDDNGSGINLNNDNDRVSHNPDGEDDDHDTTEFPGHSPLMDK